MVGRESHWHRIIVGMARGIAISRQGLSTSWICQLAALSLVCAILYLKDLGATDLWSSHEARAAQNAQCLLEDGEWLLPHLFDGQVELQKPPAFYWIVAGVAECRSGQVDRWSVRLPAALAGYITVVAVWSFLQTQRRPVAALLAGLILATAIHFVSLARTGRTDMPLTATITICLVTLHRADRWWLIVPAGLTISLALLLKGPIGLVLPLLVLVAWRFRCYLAGDFLSSRFRIIMAAAVVVGIGIALPWFWQANERTGGEFFRVFFIYHNMQRALGESAQLATHPWWYYLPRFAIDFCPWSPLLAAALWRFGREPSARRDDLAAFGLLWFAATIGVLSLAQFKRADYLLPAFPGAAIFVGCVVERWRPSFSYSQSTLFRWSLALIAIGSLAGWSWFHQFEEPRQQAPREQQAFARQIRSRAPALDPVVLFRVESHLLAWHLGKPIRTIVEWDELNRWLAQPGPHYLVTRTEFVPEIEREARTRPLNVVCRNDDLMKVAPLRSLVLMACE